MEVKDMRKTMKKLYGAMLAMALCVALLPTQAVKAETTATENQEEYAFIAKPMANTGGEITSEVYGVTEDGIPFWTFEYDTYVVETQYYNEKEQIITYEIKYDEEFTDRGEIKIADDADEELEEPKEEVKTTPSGRELAEGETVYIVKKGDCLWSIAKTLLGKGTRYKELFTRNGDIVEKAELIFPGQEIIIPAK